MITLNTSKREVFKNGQVETMHLLQLDKVKNMEFDVMCELIASRTTLSVSEVEFAMSVMSEMVIENMKQGRGTELGKLGRFMPYITVEAKEEESELKIDSLKRFRLVYRPSKQIREEIKYLKFNIKRPHAKQE